MASTTCENELSSVTFRPKIEAYSAQYDQQSMSPTMALITVVADVLDVDPLDVDQLYDAVDTDALNRLLQSGSGDDDPLRISFTFSSCDVMMSSDGHVEVAPMDETPTTVDGQ